MTRSLLHLTGADVITFLQNLVTNDVTHLHDGPVYAALLTPQGKYLADFFVISDGADGIFLDVSADLAAGLGQRLLMYKLRADVQVKSSDLHLHRGLGDAPADGWTDPRHPDMGWRAWRDTSDTADSTDWDALRVQLLVPEAGSELTPDSFILEHKFEALNGVDFRKGCYVGQEVTARMKHKTELRKGLAKVRVQGDASPGDAITANGKPVGTLHTRAGDHALAYLRFDRATSGMTCGDATVEIAQ